MVWTHGYESVEANEANAIVVDVDIELEQLQDRPKNQGEDLTEINLAEEGWICLYQLQPITRT